MRLFFKLLPLLGIFDCLFGRVEYLGNGQAKIGVDLNAGGAIVWFSRGAGGENFINHYDLGRCIQQSYYGDPDGSKWNGSPWMWNPVQGGDWRGKKAKVEEFSRTGNQIYVKTTPKHWANGKLLTACTMQSWIRLEGEVAHVRFKFEYHGDKKFAPRHQELPALFTDADCEILCLRDENGKLQRTEDVGWNNKTAKTPRNWAAYIRPKDGIGIGIYFPGTEQITYYRRAQSDWGKGAEGPACSYLAPIRTMEISPGFEIEYEIFLKIGTVEEIETAFESLRGVFEKSAPANAQQSA